MEDVLEVYQRPYDARRPVVCVDEKSKELRSEVREPIAAQPGQLERRDSEYGREGTANMFLWIEVLAGKRGISVTQRRATTDFGQLLRHLADDVYADAEKIVVVVDNLNTHGPHALYETFAAAEAQRLASRFEWHFTPEHGSWLNIAECELSVLSRQCVNRRIATTDILRTAVELWVDTRNAAHATISWQFTTVDSRIKLRRLYPTII